MKAYLVLKRFHHFYQVYFISKRELWHRITFSYGRGTGALVLWTVLHVRGRAEAKSR
jgi:hypothetical protein